MKRTFAVAVTTLMLAASAQAIAPSAKVGTPAPAITATDAISGKALDLATFKGKPVVLEWNNFGCPFVKKHYGSGNMQALQKESVKAGAVWISVNSSANGKEGYLADGKAVAAALKKSGSNATHYVLDHDGVIGRTYGAKTTPHMFVIDKTGMLVYAGAIDSKPTGDPADIKGATNYVRTALAALKAGKPVTPAQTQAYGCSIKYGY